MKQLLIHLLALVALTVQAQNKEHIQAFIDKDCYLTGEQLWVHVSVSDANGLPMTMSRVAYVELCDTLQMHAQGMVQLLDGEGWARLDLPGSMHSGNYQMNVYTNYMRNFGPQTYYSRLVGVVNLLHPSDRDEVEFVARKAESVQIPAPQTQLLTEREEYGRREKVQLRLPEIEGRGFTLSVYRNDLTTDTPFERIENNVSEKVSLDKTDGKLKYLPEIDGHIVTARTTDNAKIDNSRLALVGKRGLVFDGQVQSDGFVRFFSQDVFGQQPVTLNAYNFDDAPIHMEFVQPYAMHLPSSLPPLKVYYDESSLKERSIGAQVEKAKRDVALDNVAAHERKFQGVEPYYYYDLDEWTKFKTVREILIEFVAGIRVRNVGRHKVLFTTEAGTKNFSRWAALVLLDGMPVYDIDALMSYDARRLKYVQIYKGRFQFGENICQGVISFISRKGTLQDFLLDEGTQMYTYDFPQNRPLLLSPLDAEVPDSRHTLCFSSKPDADTEFLTSDLPGTYRVVLQFVGNDGTEQRLYSDFVVK